MTKIINSKTDNARFKLATLLIKDCKKNKVDSIVTYKNGRKQILANRFCGAIYNKSIKDIPSYSKSTKEIDIKKQIDVVLRNNKGKEVNLSVEGLIRTKKDLLLDTNIYNITKNMKVNIDYLIELYKTFDSPKAYIYDCDSHQMNLRLEERHFSVLIIQAENGMGILYPII